MQISSEVIQILEYLGEKLGVTIDWTSANVLPYIEKLCEKFIHWEINTSTAWIVIASIALVVSFIVALTININCYDDGISWVVFAFVAAIALFTIGFQIFDIIKCKTFPEKAIYDYIQFALSSGAK